MRKILVFFVLMLAGAWAKLSLAAFPSLSE